MVVLKSLLLSILLAAWFLPLLATQSTTIEPTHVVASTQATTISRCIPQERDALLAFRASFVDSTTGHLSSWRGNDCCVTGRESSAAIGLAM